MQDERVYKVAAIEQENRDGPQQRIEVVPMTIGVES
jgi:hypothetical protein